MQGQKVAVPRRQSRVEAMLTRFSMPNDLGINYKGLKVLLQRGFTVKDLSELFMVSRPTMYKILDKQAVMLHPGVTLYINARINELIVTTAA